MASRGRGRRGRPRGTGQAPQVFDQQVFVEVVGIAAATIAQAGIAGSQGGPSNLQRFRAHHPPTFTEGGDPMVVDHWFMQVKKVLEAMEITSDVTTIRLDAFQLEGEAQVWWKWARTSRDLEAMTWAEFQELFMGKYFQDTVRHAKAQEFLELKQGTMTGWIGWHLTELLSIVSVGGLPPTRRTVLVGYSRGTSMIFFPIQYTSLGVRDN